MDNDWSTQEPGGSDGSERRSRPTPDGETGRETAPCQSCGRSIAVAVDQCPRCGYDPHDWLSTSLFCVSFFLLLIPIVGWVVGGVLMAATAVLHSVRDARPTDRRVGVGELGRRRRRPIAAAETWTLSGFATVGR